MTFRYEKEMTPIVESWLLAQGYLVKKEVCMGYATIDIAGCKINERKGVLRKELRQSSTQRLFFSKRGVSKEDPIEEGYTRDVFYDRCFDTKRVEPDSFKWYPLQDDLIMIELKLKDLKKVIEQATTSFLVCDKSYIAMPYYVINKFKKHQWDLINNSEVVVISVGKDCVIIRDPGNGG